MRQLSVCSLVVFCVLLAASVRAADEVVLYASDAARLQGNWSRVSDSTAAGGQRLSSTDNGWSSTGSVLASPSDYVEWTFNASSGTNYRIWLRLKAGSNSKYNDSVYAQLSDAVDSSGSAIYRIGSGNGLTVNLQSCDGCALNGWGWIAGAYWLDQTTTFRFASSGTHTLRIQTREDGVSIDQVVLSPAAYLGSAPGPVSGDSTIVPKSANPAVGSTPFSGTAAVIPGTILAQNFDDGGPNVAYKDTTSGNTGGAYRQTDVDLQPSSEGNNNVGWIAAGEWLNYSVNVASGGSYSAAFRVASSGQGGTFHLEFDGSNVSGTITIPDTGDWQAWQTVSKTVTLTSGGHVVRLVMDTAGPGGSVGNILWVKFAAAAGGSSGGGSSPYSGAPVALPGTLSAANFDNGGEGVAYHDSSAGNSGGAYRSTDVDLEASADGGYDVGWTAAGEWINYTVNVASTGPYTVQLRVASPSGGSMHLDFNGPSNVSNGVSVPATGDWQAWTTVSLTTTLGAGVQQLTVRFDTGGMNLGAITVSGGSSTVVTGSGNTINVPAGGDLQSAINTAQPGDTILLAPGATYRGIFNLPAKSGNSYVTIRSAASDSALPGSSTRITPSSASQLPKIQGGVAGAPAIVTSAGAHHYRLLFLELSSTYAANQIVELGSDSATSVSAQPHDIIIDRCYIHGDPNNGQKRGIALNSASTSIINSYIADIKSSQEDSQAIAAWNGPGPFTIENNYLEAAGEDVLFGGADPKIPNLVISDVSFRFNYVTKNVGWRGSAWTVKNLFELKNAQRVTVDSNIFENNWEAGQSGYAILLTPRNQDGTAPWTVVQQISFTNNIVRHVSSAFNVLGYDDAAPSQQTNGITVRNNLFTDISSSRWGGAGLLVLTQGGRNLVFDHNTVFTDSNSVVYADVTPVSGFVFTNNIIPDNNWAVMGANVGEGNATLAAFYPGAVFAANVLSGANGSAYPSGNYFPSSVNAVGFVDLANGDYRLSSSSPYKGKGTDGLDIGCNVTALPQ